jgi:Na+/proline symporter
VRRRRQDGPIDMRQYRRREQRRLFWIVAAFLVVVGGLAIGLVYGLQSVILGVICLLAGAAVLALLWLILLFMERLAE